MSTNGSNYEVKSGIHRRWIFRETIQNYGSINKNLSQVWAKELQISPLFVELLWQRGCNSHEAIASFLEPKLSNLLNPALWPGLSYVAEVFTKELLEHKNLVVWGDYDVDGITATTLVLDVLEAHGIACSYYIPKRQEGYGLNTQAIEQFANSGQKLILTVDCGISDVSAIDYANSLGVKVIVTDHHLPKDKLPKALAIYDPRIEPASGHCPCPDLAGVGVAFFFMAAVNNLLAKETGKRYKMDDVLDLVALGTLADVMRLTGQNRVLVHAGLKKIASPKRAGIVALKEICGQYRGANLTAEQVSFSLAPRINASGRMDDASIALKMLRSNDIEDAKILAKKLEDLNISRKQEEDRIAQSARQQAQELQAIKNRPGFVLYAPDWHPGVIGIVASTILDEWYRPVIILCDDNGSLKGSGRSIREFDLHHGLEQCCEHLIGFGGHKLAAGVRVDSAKLEDFRSCFEKVCGLALQGNPQPTLIVERELSFEHLFDPFLRELDLLQPCGAGNAEPVFASPPLTLKKILPLGKDAKHVRLQVQDTQNSITLYAKAWNKAKEFPQSLIDSQIRIAYTPSLNTWDGVESVNLELKDWQTL